MSKDVCWNCKEKEEKYDWGFQAILLEKGKVDMVRRLNEFKHTHTHTQRERERDTSRHMT
jgi:hypothetical protein